MLATHQCVATHTLPTPGLYDELEDVSIMTAHRERAAQELRTQQMAAGPSIYKMAAQRRRNAFSKGIKSVHPLVLGLY